MLRFGEKFANAVRFAGIRISKGDRLKLALKEDRGLQLGTLLDIVNNRDNLRFIISKNDDELMKNELNQPQV